MFENVQKIKVEEEQLKIEKTKQNKFKK